MSGFDTRRLVTDICAQQRQYSWQIMNRRIALKELAVSGAEYNPSIRDRKPLGFLRDILLGNHLAGEGDDRHCRDFVVAATLPELAEKMNALQGDESVSTGPSCRKRSGNYDATIARGRSSTTMRSFAASPNCANIEATGSGCASFNRSTIPGRYR